MIANAATDQKWYLAGSVALRSVGGSDASLGPQFGRTKCISELDLLIGIKNGEKLLAEVKNAMRLKGSRSECTGALILTLFLLMRYMICFLDMTTGYLFIGNRILRVCSTA